MTTNTYTSPFTGDIVQPTDVSYQELMFGTDQALAWPAYIPPNTDYVPASRIIDCFPTTSGLSIALPPGGQGAVGQDILFVNKSAYSLVVTDFSGDQSVTLQPGDARYFYLIDNSTEDGLWNNFAYGVGTSSADAASLVGNGLTNILGKLATSTNVTQLSSPPTFNEGSRAVAFVWTGGSDVITLPVGGTVNPGWYILFRNNGTGTVELLPPGIQKIDGVTSASFNPGDSGIVVYDSSTNNFFTVGLTPPNHTTFSAATYDVDSIVGSTFNLVSYAPTIQTYVALSGTRTTNLLVELPSVTDLYVFVNNTNQNLYTISFKISGTTQVPLILSSGATALVLSDGNQLYLLTQIGNNLFYADDGSAALPSFSFNSDTATGMYLKSVNQLSFSANGIEMLTIDNSNVLDPEISTPATFTAKLITGGTF